MCENIDVINNIWYRLDDRYLNAGDYVDDKPHGATMYRIEGVPMAPDGEPRYIGALLFKNVEEARECNLRYKCKYIYMVAVDPTKIVHCTPKRVIILCYKYFKEENKCRVCKGGFPPYELDLGQYSVCLANDAKVIKAIDTKDEYDLSTQIKQRNEELLADMGIIP